MTMKKQYNITLFTLLLSVSLFGQIERFSFALNGGINSTLLKNDIPGSLSTAIIDCGANIQFNTAISHFMAIGIGAGYAKYSTEVYLDKYFNAISTIDTEGDTYEYRVYGTNVKENQFVDMVEIPFLLIFQNQEHKKFKTYLQIGVKAEIPLQSHYECLSGIIESRGYYPQYNVELSNIPTHGFDQYSLVEKKGQFLTQVGSAALLEVGTNISLEKSYISIALCGSYGLANICKQRELFTTNQIYQSLSSIAVNVIPYSVGIKVGFVFPFRPLK